MDEKNKTPQQLDLFVESSTPPPKGGGSFSGPPNCDSVNHPSHYNFAGIECIDAIKAALGPEGFRDYMMGNVMKYSWRYKYKNGIEDLKKARWYLDRTIKELEE